MKHFERYILVLYLSFLGLYAWSQNSKIDQARVNFIAQKLSLSPSESQKFWPFYNEYLDKMKNIRIERKKLFKEYLYTQNPSAAELFLKKYSELDAAENQIRMEYTQKFKQLIGVVRTAHLFMAEEEFRLELVKILKSD